MRNICLFLLEHSNSYEYYIFAIFVVVKMYFVKKRQCFFGSY